MSKNRVDSSVFISFAEENLKFVQNLILHLRNLNVKPWYYTGYMVAGTQIHQVLMETIGNASAVIIVVSRYSGQSDYVQKELHYAIQKSKIIIPIRVDNDDNPLNFILGDIAYLDAQSERDYLPDLQQALDVPPPPFPVLRNLWKRWLPSVTKARVFVILVLSLVWMGWNRPLPSAFSLLAMWMDNPFSYQPPAVPSVTTLKYFSDSAKNPTAEEVDKVLSKRFEIDTGVIVDVENPQQVERFAVLNDVFKNRKNTYDIVMIDTTWIGAFAEHLIDLRPYFKKEEIQKHDKRIIANNTVNDSNIVNGRLVAIPLFKDIGVLFYRKDLLHRYNNNKVPETWEDLEYVADNIQRNERHQSNKGEFIGFAWQGGDYEGLTVNALEWIGSQNGLDQRTGQISDKDVIVKSLDRARAWVDRDGISWQVNHDKEKESLERFIDGHAAFLRMWPGAYRQLKKANKVSFDVAPLPSASGQKSVGIVGGWQLAVPKYSSKQQEAVEFIRYLTSPQVQEWRALEGGYMPTVAEVSGYPRVKRAIPFLEDISKNVEMIARPSKDLGEDYNEASKCVHNQVYRILTENSEEEVETQVSKMQQKEDCEKFFKKNLFGS